MVSGTLLFLGLFNNLAIFIVLVSVYGFLIGYFENSNWIRKQIAFGLTFGLFAISCMYIKIPVAEGVIVDQRNTIITLSGAFGGPLSALLCAAIAGAYRIYLGGKGALGGTIGVSLSAFVGICIYKLLVQKDKAWPMAISAFIATLIILPGFLFIGDLYAGWILMKSMALPYGSAVFLGIFLLGLLLAREDRLHKAVLMEKTTAERLRDFAESASDWFWEIDQEFKFTFISDRYEEISGLKIADAMGTRFWDGDEGGQESKQWHTFHQDLHAKKPFKNVEYALQLPNDKTLHVRISGLPTYDKNHQFTGYRGSATDITTRKQAEEEQEKLQEQLSQSQKMESIGRLAGGVAHDFNNMLGVILGYSELAMLRLDSSQTLYAQLKEIQLAAEHSADLTRQLLAFARKQIVAPKVLDLNSTISGMLKMLRRLIGENIDLRWLPTPDLWSVKMDPSQINQLVANLCVNARDAIDGVGKITIETANATFDHHYCAEHADFLPGEYVLFAVSDDGCGMDKETINRLFEPFFTTKAQDKGTGLGLATVYGIVKQNQGFIHVYSEPGMGTTLKIYLSRHLKEESLSPEKSVPDFQGGNETILLVEDEIALLNLGKVLLENLGYRVLSSNSPREALQIAKDYRGKIHLLVTDVIMPEMNGRELSTQLQALFPRLKTLYTSGYTTNVIAHHGVLEEGLHFIQKPFAQQALAHTIRQILEMESN